MRNGVYYFRKKVAIRNRKRIISQSLKTNNLSVARTRAKLISDALDSEKFDMLDNLKSHLNFVSIGEITSTYLRLIQNYNRPSRDTAQRNIWALHLILRIGGGFKDPDRAGTQVLTSSLVMKYANSVIGQAEDRNRAMRTVSSYLRQARSVFSKRMRHLYRAEGLKLPNMEDFLMTVPCDNPRPIREDFSPAEIKIIKSGSELKGKRDDLYVVWLLGYYLAMRAGEIAHAKWSWIEKGPDGNYEMKICERPDEGFDPKGYNGWVPIADDVYKLLEAMRRDDDSYIVPGGTTFLRHRLVVRDFADWMRSQGWTRPHCSHELRAYRGNIWRHTLGLEIMRDWLRHSTVEVGINHYTTRHNNSKPPMGVEA